jgi:sigma-B regulation protein RsbU (phosphoserine phosphatase)
LANTSDIGVESAILALEMNSVFYSQAEMCESPERLINITNQVLCSSRFTDRYATALYIMYDTASREIVFSNAAFNPFIIFDPKNESFVEFDSEGIPIGIDIRFNYKHRTLIAPLNGIGFCYSQGLSAAFNKEGDNYSISRIKDIIKMNMKDTSISLVKKIYNDFEDFTQGSNLLNDVTLIVFKTS